MTEFKGEIDKSTIRARDINVTLLKSKKKKNINKGLLMVQNSESTDIP